MSEDRSLFIGGSDAAAVLGLSPWKTALRLYMEKKGEAPPPEEKDRRRERILARGKREEPHIVDDLIELYGLKVTTRSTPEKPNRHRDVELPYLAAEIDFEWEVTAEAVESLSERGVAIPEELIGTIQNGECKTMHPFVAKHKIGEEGTDEIPVEYYCQAQHGLMISGRKLALVAVAVYVDDPLVYLVTRDDENIADMREREVKFMEEHLRKGVPPSPVDIPDVHLLLAQKKKALKREVTPEIMEWIRDLARHRGLEEVHKLAADEAKFEIGRFLLGAEEATDPKAEAGRHVLMSAGLALLEVRLGSRTGIDSKKLQASYPEAAAACTKTSKFYEYKRPRKGTKA